MNMRTDYDMPILEETMDSAIRRLKPFKPMLGKKQTLVLEYVAAGFTAQETADQMKISKRTVETHKSTLMSRFSVTNTAHMISKAYKCKILKIN